MVITGPKRWANFLLHGNREGMSDEDMRNASALTACGEVVGELSEYWPLLGRPDRTQYVIAKPMVPQ